MEISLLAGRPAPKNELLRGRNAAVNPNHYLAVAIRYLLTHRPGWTTSAAVGKTLVSSNLIERVVQKLGRRLCEVTQF